MYAINTTMKTIFTYKIHIIIASKFSGQNIFSIWKINIQQLLNQSTIKHKSINIHSPLAHYYAKNHAYFTP